MDIIIEENPLIEELIDDSDLLSEIPSWIKNNAEWWADDSIDDDSFIQGIQFLIKEGIMTVSN